MNQPLDLRKLLAGYIPMAALLVAAALFVAVVPTVSPPQGRSAGSTTDELLAGAAALQTGSAGVDPATGETIGTDGTGGTDGTDGTGGTDGTEGTGATDGTGGTGGTGPGSPRPATGGYRPTGQDCSRQAVIESPRCRPTPAFSGDNGGATYTNVTADTIRIVVYEPGSNAQVEGLLSSFGAGGANDGANRDMLEAFESYFNENFETYGRRVRITFQRGPGEASVPDQQTADAVAVAEELDATIVLSAVGSTAFHDELARRGIPAISGALQFRSAFYEQRSPYLFSLVPDLDIILDNSAEYWCKRLKDRNAVHAGDPLYQGQVRRLGIIHPDDNQEMTGGLALKQKIEACGGSVARVVAYASDVSTAQQQATNGIAQLKAAGVTTVTCTCDPIAPIFFTTAATNQAYFPEWLQNGVLLTDLPDFGRLYNQQQWANSFGTSAFGKPTPVAQGAAWKAYFAAKPNGSRETAAASGAYYALLLYAFSAIEAAGPQLTATSFAQGMFSLPALGGTAPDIPHISFGANGPSPYTGIDDVTEIWWDADRTGPDGKTGYNFYVESGRRRQLGTWPTTDPNVLVDDGSPQPQRDPDR